MKRVAFATLLACACGSPNAARTVEAPPLEIAPLDAGALARPTQPNPSVVELELPSFIASPEVQSVLAANVGAFLNVRALRSHALGARLREIARSKAPGMELFDEVDWVLYAGNDFLHTERGFVLVGVRPGADVQWTLERLTRGSSSRPLESVEVEGASGWRVEREGLVLRLRDDLVAVVHEPRAGAVVASFRKGVPAIPSPRAIVGAYATGEGARLGGILGRNEAFVELRLGIDEKGDGLELRLEGRCRDPANAALVAQKITDVIAAANDAAVRVATRGLLDDAKATANGDAVALVLDADERQLGAIVDAFAALP